MKRSIMVTSVILGFTLPVLAQQHRQLGPHQHGHGKLNIAIENNQIMINLDVPGVDIIGFEREPVTSEENAAFEAGKARLSDVLSIFNISQAADCKVKNAKVTVEGEPENAASQGETAAVQEEEGEHHHSDFNADYMLECRSVQSITAIDFDYFKVFEGAQVLDVTLVTPKGQNRYEVTREKPTLDMTSVM